MDEFTYTDKAAFDTLISRLAARTRQRKLFWTYNYKRQIYTPANISLPFAFKYESRETQPWTTTVKVYIEINNVETFKHFNSDAKTEDELHTFDLLKDLFKAVNESKHCAEKAIHDLLAQLNAL